ncbi:lipid A export permease/ATP-binding protein MsbA [Simiduia curdlanivorans]|uniref:Lipid A export permease/ATP-binding protein MsbA n=1 Tax=Simiduia curdlanivorans TaxID=1492769 RepID=A0ABV8V107_9GAMM|nr:lipid A export permease/ATP-binding protein MsbA [Simiduia curdlanivorans]MDN3637777.1 lipid A export permease/ATP-binding protein MsbA [Simiduia curdlanivorans]
MSSKKNKDVAASLDEQQFQTAGQVYLRLLSYVKPYWFYFSLSILGFIIFAGSQPAFAVLMEYLINAIPKNDPSDRWLIPVWLMSIFAVRGLGHFIGSYYSSRVSLAIVHTLRTQLFNQLTKMPGYYFDNNNSGHLISRITFNVTQVTGAATEAFKVIVREGFTVIGLLGYLFYQDWKLTLIFLGVGPLIGVLVWQVGLRLRRLSAKVQGSMGDVTHIASEMINGYRVMRSFGGQAYESKRFDDASTKNTKQNLKIVTTSAINTPVIQFLVAGAMGFVMFLALTYMGTSDPGAFVAYITAAGLMPKPVRQLSEVNSTIQKGIAAANTIFMQLDEKVEVDSGSHVTTRVRGELNIKHLNFSYDGENAVLKDINLHIKPGQTVALVGRSGSGKTTLASLIPRFYQHADGDILLDDVPIQDYTLASLRDQIALVSQQVTLFNDTVYNNIAYGTLSDAPEEAVVAAAKAAHALEFINDMPEGLQTLIGEDGVRLSGGQRQRLAIARALLKDAPLLILDEATSALDTESERGIQEALEAVMKNRTTLVIAHRLTTIENAHHIVVMDAGKIVEQGNHQSLIALRGYYAKLHAMQFEEETE